MAQEVLQLQIKGGSAHGDQSSQIQKRRILRPAFRLRRRGRQDKFDKSVRYRGSLQNYLIDTGDEVILVDTGLPAGTPEEVPDENSPLYTGKDICSYMEAVAALDYKAEQVTKILLTQRHATTPAS